ncbi:MAG: 5'/3'-nucleotidase SurE [Phycisphaeraceae bacterium]|nr:5'/3'-nucleotidase SurE [Phycisphaeraceae bacterium]
MRILLTNDDGIRAPGIVALHDALIDARNEHGGPLLLPREHRASPHHEFSLVTPIAPLTVQSATGHGVTFDEPLMVQDVKVNERMGGIAVDGRPADCVKLAISSLWPERHGKDARPDLLISGMNAGANCGINVIYSGTVAAAIEGAFLGVPSIAVSMLIRPGPLLFDVAARWGRETIERLLAGGLPDPHEIISINIPTPERDGPRPPIRVCPMNTHGLVDAYERRVSPAGNVYYWAAGHGLDFHATDAGTDVAELMGGCITVTPLRYDLTRHETMTRWRARLGL